MTVAAPMEWSVTDSTSPTRVVVCKREDGRLVVTVIHDAKDKCEICR